MTMILGRAALGLGLGLIAALLLTWRPLQRFPEATSRRWLWRVMVLSRLALFSVVYLALGQSPRADVSAYYLPQGWAVLAGETVYRDFPSSYGPLFPYVTAAALFLESSGRGFIFLSVLIDLAGYYLWGIALRRSELPERQIQMGEALYILSPLAVMASGLGGNRPWLGALLAAAAGLALARRPFASGLVIGMSFLLTRVLAGMFVPAVARMFERARWGRLLFGIVLPLAVAALWMWALHANPFLALGDEADKISGGNLPFLFFLVTGTALPSSVPLGLLTGVLLLVALRREKWGDGNALRPIAISQLAFMLLSPKSFAGYFLFAALPTLALIRWTPRTLLALAVWHMAMAAEASCHFRWFNGKFVQLDVSDWRTVVLLLAELTIVGGYGFMLRSLVGTKARGRSSLEADAVVISASGQPSSP